MDEGYWTTNKAFILRGSICRWIQKELNSRFESDETFIGFVSKKKKEKFPMSVCVAPGGFAEAVYTGWDEEYEVLQCTILLENFHCFHRFD